MEFYLVSRLEITKDFILHILIYMRSVCVCGCLLQNFVKVNKTSTSNTEQMPHKIKVQTSFYFILTQNQNIK